MKNFSHLAFFAFLISVSVSSQALAFEYLDDEAEAGGFDITATVTKLPIEWNLNEQEDGEAYRLRITPTSAELGTVEGGKVTPLASTKTTVATGPLAIQRRGPRWIVLAANRIVLQAEDDRWMDGRVGHRGGGIESIRLQPVEEIAFDDDFMRVAEEVAYDEAKANPSRGTRIDKVKVEETLWTAVAGSWTTSGISEQEQAMVAQSANPFSFVSKSKGVNLALAGRPFWSDYYVEAAVKPQQASSVALVLYAQDAENYLAFEWQQSGLLALRSVLKDTSRVIASAQSEGYDDKNWYRLKFAVSAGVLRGFIDDEEVLRASTDLFGGGQVGLMAKNPEDADAQRYGVFDDLRVRSVEDFYDDFSVPVAGRWQTASGAWELKGAATPVDKRGSFTVMGRGDWQDYTTSADVTLPADAAAGLVSNHISGDGAYVFRVAGSRATAPYAGKAQIFQIGGGKTAPLAEVDVGNRFDDKTGRWSFSSERGYLQGTIEVNGKSTRIIDAWSEDNRSGRAGLYAHRGNTGVPKINNFAVEFPQQKSVWAKIPDLYEDERQAETMGGWSTPEGLWLPDAPVKNATEIALPADTSRDKLFWHKGTFWGDQDIRFKLPDLTPEQNITLVLGAAAGSASTPLFLSLKTDGTNLKAVLFRGAKQKLKEGSLKIEDTLEGKPIEISRRGNFVVVRAGGEFDQSTLLVAKTSG